MTAGLACVLLAILFTACRSFEPQPADPYERFRPALKSEYQNYLDELGPVPIYDIEVTYDDEENRLVGQASIEVPNYSAEPWNDLLFRLYPMLEQYGGNMVLQRVAVNGQPASFIYKRENTAIEVDLNDTLQPGDTAVVDLAWRLEIPNWSDISSIYALFGSSQDMTALPLFYPSLAVYEEGDVLGDGQWWQALGSVRGDAAYNVTSLFAVTATMPSELVPVTSGTLVTSTLTGDGLARHAWVTGPSREFVMHLSPHFESDSTEAYGTRVTSYWLPGDETAGRAALKHASSALRIYSDIYGPYPYQDMRVAPAPISFHGMEYPQVNLLGIELYGRFRDRLELIAAHEVAHQWWYQLIHNDPVNSPWLDEAIAEYSMEYFVETLDGEYDADLFEYNRWWRPLEHLIERDENAPVDQPVDSFIDGAQYEAIVYGKGALFFDALREELGDRAFRAFLRKYLDEHRYGIVDQEEWEAALESLGNPIVMDLYEAWITGKE